MSNYTGVSQSLEHMQSEWNRSRVGKGSANSILALWREAVEMRQFLSNQRENALSAFRADADKYNPEYREKKRRELDSAYEESAAEIRNGFKEDVRKYVQKKEAKLDEMIAEPPTEQQYNLLRSLQMRGKSVSQAELLRLMPVFFSNYSAIKTLEEIGKTIGLKFSSPVGDAAEMYEKLRDAEEYMITASNEIGKTGKPNMLWAPFFFRDPEQPDMPIDTSVLHFSEVFDRLPQLQTEATESLTFAETAKVRAMFSEVRKLDPEGIGKPHGVDNIIKVSQLTEQILADNPNDVLLILRSPEYGHYAQLALAVKKARMDMETVNKAAEGKGAGLDA